MRRWLLAAAAYNLLWGAAAIAFPLPMLAALGVVSATLASSDGDSATLPVIARLWACIGMIVGVYGVGYAIAAMNPLRHWPIVLVGLIGKVLGPIGFVDAALRGDLPWAMGVTIIFNDLLWWVPFAAILHAAWRAGAPAARPSTPMQARE
ncbi:MAG TPA: alkyl hydroperoxide reductase [Phycisphaerales bacterium]|nr:alkyl hydroperoxide reductase [Phycisphaerales bacterium]HMP36605.1 alkyl hydroperoxide reductase [Phycisphaerales bacterium]